MKIKTNSGLENYELLQALVKQKEYHEKYNNQKSIEAINRIIEQCKGYPCYSVLVED